MEPEKKQKVEPMILDTYLSTIKNSVGSKMFRNLYAKVKGKKKDITENGNLSCALYVSSILYLYKLIKDIHATVDGTLKDLQNSGWREIKNPKVGCVIVWDKVCFGSNNTHKHIGFYIRDNTAISNNSKEGCIAEHNWCFNGERQVTTLLWNSKLD